MTTVIDTIIFDLGGVLIDHKPEYLFRSIFKNNIEKMEWFLENVCTSDWNMEQDAGRTIAAANNLKIAEFPEYIFRLSDGPFFSMEKNGSIYTWNVFKLYEENKRLKGI